MPSDPPSGIKARSRESRRSLLRPRRYARRRSLDSILIGKITNRDPKMYRKGMAAYGLILILGLWRVFEMSPSLLWPFVMIAASSLVAIGIWISSGLKGLPVLPAFVVQQVLVYLMPIAVQNESIQGYSMQVMNSSAASVALFLLLLPLGWLGGRAIIEARPARWRLELNVAGEGGALPLKIALLFLTANIAFEVLVKEGVIRGIPQGVMPIIKAGLAAGSALGAFLGAFVISFQKGGNGKSARFWAAFLTLFILTASGLLLSGVTLMVVAAAMGLGLGAGRVPWLFLITVGGGLAFLNVSKFDMREKYWREGGDAANRLVDLPAFYIEWSEASIRNLSYRAETQTEEARNTKLGGQSLLDRIDNMQNLVFVVHAEKALNVSLLRGETYKLIPPLFIPRFLWPEKPRTHEGQILLNLHFGRQMSVEATETTYVAWGLLPEAVGNFGPIGGALFLGPLLGFCFGMLEKWSMRKRLFSIEAVVAVALLLQILISFEKVASVFLTSTFQMTLVLVAGCIAFRVASGKKPMKSRGRRRAPTPANRRVSGE